MSKVTFVFIAQLAFPNINNDLPQNWKKNTIILLFCSLFRAIYSLSVFWEAFGWPSPLKWCVYIYTITKAARLRTRAKERMLVTSSVERISVAAAAAVIKPNTTILNTHITQFHHFLYFRFRLKVKTTCSCVSILLHIIFSFRLFFIIA